MRKTIFETFDVPRGTAPQQAAADEESQQCCAYEGCDEAGVYPAPRSREHLRDYIWLCLAHVRDYNSKWNYFDGYDEQAMENAIRCSVTWDRPSWKFGTSKRKITEKQAWQAQIDDPFDIIGDRGDAGDGQSGTPKLPPMSDDEKKAWSIFGLSPCTDAQRVKKRYKELVKANHPDANGGSTHTEDLLKKITWAYSVLKKIN